MATGAPVTSKDLCLATETNLSIMQDCKNPDTNRNDFAFQGVRAILDSQDEEMIYSNAANQNKPGDADCPARTVYLKYLKPDCEETASMDCVGDWDCETGVEEKLTYERVAIELTECIEDSFTVKPESFRCQCDSDPITELQTKLTRSVRKGMAAYQKKLIEKMYAGVGTSYNGTTGALPLNIFDASGKPQPMGLFSLQNEYSKQNPNCPDQPIILTGSEKFNAYQCASNVFRGNTDGYDPNSSCYNINNVYFDRTVQQCLATLDPELTNGVLAFLPGSVHVAHYYDFESEYSSVNPAGRSVFAPMQSSGSVLRQKVDVGTPTLGIPFVVDLQIIYKECEGLGGTITYKWRKCFDLCKIPQGAFCSTYNYCTLWNVDCVDTDCTTLC